ncbi:MAG: HEAT repeat domain-containing protein [Chloroflexi bacterium]|nr:HEAT repeat domain-containing protein [Chloroflexota bacterium]
MGLEEFLAKLPDRDRPVPYHVLAELSAVSDDDARRLSEIWAAWDSSYLRQIFKRLASLAEDNALYEFDSVFQAGLKNKDAGVRAISVTGLSESSDRRLPQRLAQMLVEDPSEEVRVAAAMGLARFALAACEGKLIRRDYDRIRDALMMALNRKDETRDVRRRAIEAFGVFPLDLTEPFILKAYQSGDRALQQSALYAMGKSGNRRWLPEITTSLASESAAVRYEAVTALGLIGEEGDIELLVGALEDDDLQVRASALIALGRMGGAAARRILTREARNKNPAIAEAAQEGLEEFDMGDPLFGDQPGVLGIVPEEPHEGNGRGKL